MVAALVVISLPLWTQLRELMSGRVLFMCVPGVAICGVVRLLLTGNKTPFGQPLLLACL